MKLLLLTPEFSRSGGGIATFYRTLVPALARAGVSVRVIEGSAFAATSSKEIEVQDGVRVETLVLDRFRHWHDRFERFTALPTLRRHLAAAWAMWEQASEGENADIVEACDWGLSFIPPLVEVNSPLVIQCHGSIGQIGTHDPISGGEAEAITTQLLERAALAAATEVQTSSSANADYWRRESGHHVRAIAPAHASPLRDSQITHQRGLAVGRLQRWKGPLTLCRALQLLGGRAPEIDWIGRDAAWQHSARSSTAFLAASFPAIWGTKLHHLPPRSPEEVAKAQASAAFNVVPSTWDVFNFTVAEAMSSGRPTIVSTGAGASELIEDGINGFLFDADDAEGLAAAIDRVLSTSAAKLIDITASARATIAERLAPDLIAQQRISAYKDTLSRFAMGHQGRELGTLNAICRPDRDPQSDGMTFLEHQPLRRIVRHVAGRIARKAGMR